MRGTEGEPVADARRLPKLDVFIAGTPRPELGRQGLRETDWSRMDIRDGRIAGS